MHRQQVVNPPYPEAGANSYADAVRPAPLPAAAIATRDTSALD
jgi:hypothetical protein